ncbi:WD40/YVTN/BNR-like repeat-containing protein [Solimonas terrae]|uniref:Photosystem II stability/assembly factor-like protein n=1 Tax=Solimonas terrae TaxID=1396819 RepID=A0A6M2BQ55_9GAMM|nr:YCF48-related protein [Solimonas terrae]NGY04484.1 photosystem II stability/assembly factor-like protein [Solimonas terrae]
MALRDCLVVVAAALVSSAAGAAEPQAALSPVVSGTVHQALFSIAMDGKNGYATGAAGEILGTDDGGQTWKAMTPAPTPLSLLGVTTSGGRTLAVGQKGLVLSLQDGKWKPIDSGSTSRLFSVQVNHKGDALAVGEFGTVLVSSDGGQHWRNAAPDWNSITEHGEEPHLYDALVDDSGAMTMAGEFGLILRSTDGGASWHELHRGDASIFGLAFDGQGRGYAVGQVGTVLRTDDDGKTWTTLSSGSQANLLAVQPISHDVVVISGVRGSLITHDGGQSWQTRAEGPLGSLWFSDLAGTADGVLVVGQAGEMVRMQP